MNGLADIRFGMLLAMLLVLNPKMLYAQAPAEVDNSVAKTSIENQVEALKQPNSKQQQDSLQQQDFVQQPVLDSTTIQNNKTQNIVQSENNKSAKELYKLVTSADYADATEIKKPIAKNNDINDWLKKLFEYLKGEEQKKSSKKDAVVSGVAWLPLMLKSALVLLLFFVIYLLVKNRHALMNWASGLSMPFSEKNSIQIEDFEQAHLYQGWEKLPSHEHIPEVVSQLLAQGNLIAASSILYRGGLRWFNINQQLNIRPATTEVQTMQLLNRVYELTLSNKHYHQIQHSTQVDVNNRGQFMVGIIKSWMYFAYASNVDTQITSSTTSQNTKNLQNHADNWLELLPVSQNFNNKIRDNALANSKGAEV